MKDTAKHAGIERVLQHMAGLKRHSAGICRCLDQLQAAGEVALLGGAVRDILAGKTPRDYDLVVQAQDSTIEAALEGLPHRRNRFGGFKVNTDGVELDIWHLDKTWCFERGLIEASWDNLERSAFFNIDSVNARLTSQRLVDDIYRATIRSGILDILFDETALAALDHEAHLHPLCALRAFVLAEEHRLHFSPRLRTYLKRWVLSSVDPLAELTMMQKSHYNEQRLSDAKLHDCVAWAACLQ